MRAFLILPLTAPFALLAAPATAQVSPVAGEASAPASDGGIDIGGEAIAPQDGDEILVIATRLRGSVDAPQPPVMTLDEADIESYGAASLGDLISAISPQTGSGRGRGDGRPVFLVNGQRISNFREMRNIPPEAIRKLEVLPEEVALRYGYPPNQRVINFILKDDFASRSIDAEYNVPTRGGFTNTELEGTILRIAGTSRFNLTGKTTGTTMLRESERGVIQQAGSLSGVAGDPDPARYRSLIDDSREYSLNGTWTSALGEGPEAGALTLSGAVTRSASRNLFGLDNVLLVAPDGSSVRRTIDDPLLASSRALTVEAGAALNKSLGAWQLAVTVDGSHSDTRSRTETNADTTALVAAAVAGSLPIAGPLPALPDTGFDRARTKDDAVKSLVTVSGRPFSLPAGEVALTVKAGFDYTRSDNTDSRTGNITLGRKDASAGVNLALPLTSRRDNVLGAVGDLSLNLSAGINHLSDFGTLKDWSVGLTWKPTDRLGLQASTIVNEAAPSLNQLGNPEQLAYNVSVYDFTRGEAVLVTIINGGNPALVREKQRDLKISANWELPVLKNSNLIVEYFRNRSTDVTQGFPLLTPAIEAAFPGRAIRDAGGRLVSIDRRPVTFAEIAGSRLRWGFNISGTVGKPQPVAEGLGGGRFGGMRGGGGGGRGGPGGGMGAGGPSGGGGPGFMGRGGGNGQGRWNLSLYHTVRFTDTATIAPGVPRLDLLGGDALSVGGVARHNLELEGGVFHKGLGLRVSGTWKAPVTVRTTSAAGNSDLRFGSTAVINLRAFVNFDQKEQLVKQVPFLKGSRLALTVDNLFDSRQKVTDAQGIVPLAYQADYRDPRGRVIGIDFRKMF